MSAAATQATPTPAAPAGDSTAGAGADSAALAAWLDGAWAPQRDEARASLADPAFAPVDPELPRDAYRDQVLAWLQELGRQGAGLLGFAEEYGGQADPGGRVARFQVLGMGDLSLMVKCGVQFGLFAGAIDKLGTDRHRAAYLRDAGDATLPGCFAMSESGHGSDVRNLRTTACFDRADDSFVLTTPDDRARKDWIGNAARHGRAAVVFCQLEVAGTQHGVHALVVPLRDESGALLPGIRIEDCGHKLGLNGVDNGRIWFDNVRVPRANLLDRFAAVDADGVWTSPIDSDGRRFFSMLGALVEGRISIAGASIAAAMKALTVATRYGETRRQFGSGSGDPQQAGPQDQGDGETPLLDYLTHQRRLLPRIATVYAQQAAWQHLVERYTRSVVEGVDEAEQREIEGLAAGLKALASWHATAAIQDSRECCGGQGYLSANQFAALKADSEIFTTFEGDNTVLLQQVAKAMLTEYAQQFEDMSLPGMVRTVTDRIASFVAGANPFARLGSGADVRDPAWQIEAFSWREQDRIDALGRRLKAAIDEGLDPWSALIRCQDHALETAGAQLERICLEQFTARVEAAPAAARPTLEQLRDLYAVTILHADRGWLLEHGHLTPGASKGLVTSLNELCAQLRPDAVALVDAFRIPEQQLTAPIAHGRLA
ncbi:MAG TPA: acyl-CoA dehydrogenase [Frankiaceae bacterium]